MNQLAVDLVSEIDTRIGSNRRHQGDNVPLPTAFCSLPKGKCGLLLATFANQLRSVTVAAVVHFAYYILACRPRASGRKILIIIT